MALNRRQFFPPKVICIVWKYFWVVIIWGRSMTDTCWVKAVDAVEHPIMIRQLPKSKNYPAPKVNSAEFEKL